MWPENRTTSNTASGADLGGEARFFYRRLLGGVPSPEIISLYIRAHEEIEELRTIGAEQQRTIELILVHDLDATGIEPWLRGNQAPHALGIKLRMLAYLSECAEAHPKFGQRPAGLLRTFARLGFCAVPALFSLVRGYVQKSKHGLL